MGAGSPGIVAAVDGGSSRCIHGGNVSRRRRPRGTLTLSPVSLEQVYWKQVCLNRDLHGIRWGWSADATGRSRGHGLVRRRFRAAPAPPPANIRKPGLPAEIPPSSHTAPVAGFRDGDAGRGPEQRSRGYRAPGGLFNPPPNCCSNSIRFDGRPRPPLPAIQNRAAAMGSLPDGGVATPQNAPVPDAPLPRGLRRRVRDASATSLSRPLVMPKPRADLQQLRRDRLSSIPRRFPCRRGSWTRGPGVRRFRLASRAGVSNASGPGLAGLTDYMPLGFRWRKKSTLWDRGARWKAPKPVTSLAHFDRPSQIDCIIDK